MTQPIHHNTRLRPATDRAAFTSADDSFLLMTLVTTDVSAQQKPTTRPCYDAGL